jgi:hypothetical protein
MLALQREWCPHRRPTKQAAAISAAAVSAAAAAAQGLTSSRCVLPGQSKLQVLCESQLWRQGRQEEGSQGKQMAHQEEEQEAVAPCTRDYVKTNGWLAKVRNRLTDWQMVAHRECAT